MNKFQDGSLLRTIYTKLNREYISKSGWSVIHEIKIPQVFLKYTSISKPLYLLYVQYVRTAYERTRCESMRTDSHPSAYTVRIISYVQ